MTSPNNNAKLREQHRKHQSAWRQRQRDKGLKTTTVYAYPEDIPRIRDYAAGLRKRHK